MGNLQSGTCYDTQCKCQSVGGGGTAQRRHTDEGDCDWHRTFQPRTKTTRTERHRQRTSATERHPPARLHQLPPD